MEGKGTHAIADKGCSKFRLKKRELRTFYCKQLKESRLQILF